MSGKISDELTARLREVLSPPEQVGCEHYFTFPHCERWTKASLPINIASWLIGGLALGERADAYGP